MKVLVIGGTGFIGPFVVRDLVLQGHDVTVYHRGMHRADLAKGVRCVRNPAAEIPVTYFPTELLSGPFDCAIHMIPMGETDARAAVAAFTGRLARMVALSSGDVYLAHGRLIGIEPGPIEPMPLTEDSPLRTVMFPYRAKAASSEALEYWYEKILMESIFLSSEIPVKILRLPKVYGPRNNHDFATVHRYRHQPTWRWTHGYVENVASAIVLAATHPRDGSRIYNVGEPTTPTVAERLKDLPPSEIPADTGSTFSFSQDIVYSTARIRAEFGYSEPVPYLEGLQRTSGNLNSSRS